MAKAGFCRAFDCVSKIFAIGLTIAGVLTAAPALAASSDATIEATQFEVKTGEFGEAVAVCPGKKRVTGGGVVQSGSPNGFLLKASGPLDKTGVTVETSDGDKATQWYGAVENFSGDTRAFRVFAICSSTSDAKIEATQFEAKHFETAEALAVCSGNKRAIGGGVVQSGNTNVDLNASGPLDSTGVTVETNDGDKAKQWYGNVYNSDDDTRIFRVFALCSRKSKATIEATQFSLPESGLVEAAAVCPGGKRAVGGGVVQSGVSGSMLVAASGPLDAGGVTAETNDGDKATQWYAAVYSANGAKVARVFAICE